MTSTTIRNPRAATALPSHSVSFPTCHAAVGKVRAMLHKAEPYGQAAVLLALRLIYGWFFVETGWGKLANLERTSNFFASLGLPAPSFMANLVGSTELAGGILLMLGLVTRFTSSALTLVLLTALATAHAQGAFTSLTAFTEQSPYPFLVATLMLLAFGAGRLSIDAVMRSRIARTSQHVAKATD